MLTSRNIHDGSFGFLRFRRIDPHNLKSLEQRDVHCPLQDALHPVNASVKETVSQISDIARQLPDLSFPIKGQQAQSWLLNTYLDSVSRLSKMEINHSIPGVQTLHR